MTTSSITTKILRMQGEHLTEQDIKEQVQKEVSRAFELGRVSAFKEILLIISENPEVWEKYAFTQTDSRRFALSSIKHLTDRLEKAKTVYKAQQRLLNEMSQLSVDD